MKHAIHTHTLDTNAHAQQTGEREREEIEKRGRREEEKDQQPAKISPRIFNF